MVGTLTTIPLMLLDIMRGQRASTLTVEGPPNAVFTRCRRALLTLNATRPQAGAQRRRLRVNIGGSRFAARRVVLVSVEPTATAGESRVCIVVRFDRISGRAIDFANKNQQTLAAILQQLELPARADAQGGAAGYHRWRETAARRSPEQRRERDR